MQLTFRKSTHLIISSRLINTGSEAWKAATSNRNTYYKPFQNPAKLLLPKKRKAVWSMKNVYLTWFFPTNRFRPEELGVGREHWSEHLNHPRWTFSGVSNNRCIRAVVNFLLLPTLAGRLAIWQTFFKWVETTTVRDFASDSWQIRACPFRWRLHTSEIDTLPAGGLTNGNVARGIKSAKLPRIDQHFIRVKGRPMERPWKACDWGILVLILATSRESMNLYISPGIREGSFLPGNMRRHCHARCLHFGSMIWRVKCAAAVSRPASHCH